MPVSAGCAWGESDAYADEGEYRGEGQFFGGGVRAAGSGTGVGVGGALGAALDSLADMFVVEGEETEGEDRRGREKAEKREPRERRANGSVRAQALVEAKSKAKGGGNGPGPTVQALARADEMLEVCCWMGSVVMAGFGAFLAGLLPGAIVFLMATLAAGVAASFARVAGGNSEVRRGRQVREVLQQPKSKSAQRPAKAARERTDQREAVIRSGAMAKLQEEREWRQSEGVREARHAQLKALAAHNAKLPSVPSAASHHAESFLAEDVHAQAAEIGVEEGMIAYEMMRDGQHNGDDTDTADEQDDVDFTAPPVARLSKHMYYKELPDGTRAYSVRQEPANSASNLHAWDSRKPRRPTASASLPESTDHVDEQTREMDIKFQEAKLRARQRLWAEEEAKEMQISHEAIARNPPVHRGGTGATSAAGSPRLLQAKL